jgi:hypothetical protein
MARFVDSLQRVATMLPLRVVPLEVQVFTPVQTRLSASRREALIHQQRAVEAWARELDRRFPGVVRNLPIVDVALG